MTVPSALHRPSGIPPSRRAAARAAVALARLLAFLPPGRVRTVLAVVRAGARPATYEQARAARETVTGVSLACLGPRGCLPRSLATALLCRLGGAWPTWCVGARTLPPFGAHAWVEAEGRLVEENVPDGYLAPLMTVPPRTPRRDRRRDAGRHDR
ncbi:lasso peptide biosynthesis B2 protein [Actinomadura sp. KC06]|uniref:lasso peptide biosynthesis B2 protein n=1 Tax=Actinomadura sp. KC06 TaxID=2530369 RepID=UPI0010446768|nr:lasso peptide biosynthesis B2 protein [Actinomadura sp. KC06]TDD27623.1 lasso peptide biosynthesis B2 protein [Actinomadura sp. KC06]